MPKVAKQGQTQIVEVGAELHPPKLEAVFDQDLNAVIFPVADRVLAVREPRPVDFMNLEAWMRTPSDDEVESTQKRDVAFISLKLVSLCSIDTDETKKINYSGLCNLIRTFDDVEVIGSALAFFSDSVGEYFKRVAKSTSPDSNLPGASSND